MNKCVWHNCKVTLRCGLTEPQGLLRLQDPTNSSKQQKNEVEVTYAPLHVILISCKSHAKTRTVFIYTRENKILKLHTHAYT